MSFISTYLCSDGGGGGGGSSCARACEHVLITNNADLGEA